MRRTSSPTPPPVELVPKQVSRPELGAPEFAQLLAVDFDSAYRVYLASADERLKMLRLALSLLAAPFAAAIALISADVVAPADLDAWHTVPWYLFGLVLSFGALGILPYIRLIESTGAHLRTARALNNFRRLYAEGLKDHFARLGWSPNLPVDPKYPESFAPLSWEGVNVLVLALLNACYIAVGLLGLSGAAPSPVLLAGVILLVALLLFLVYYVQTNVRRRGLQPENPFNAPFVET